MGQDLELSGPRLRGDDRAVAVGRGPRVVVLVTVEVRVARALVAQDDELHVRRLRARDLERPQMQPGFRYARPASAPQATNRVDMPSTEVFNGLLDLAAMEGVPRVRRDEWNVLTVFSTRRSPTPRRFMRGSNELRSYL